MRRTLADRCRQKILARTAYPFHENITRWASDRSNSVLVRWHRKNHMETIPRCNSPHLASALRLISFCARRSRKEERLSATCAIDLEPNHQELIPPDELELIETSPALKIQVGIFCHPSNLRYQQRFPPVSGRFTIENASLIRDPVPTRRDLE